MSTYFGKLISSCDDVLAYSDRFRRALGAGDMREATEASALAARDLDHIAVSVRRLQEGAVVNGDDVDALGRIEIGALYKDLGTVSWAEVERASRVPPTCHPWPLYLKDALDKRIHTLIGSFRLDQDAHVLLSHGKRRTRRDGDVSWVAEWSVARFIEATRGMLVIAEARAPAPSQPRRAA